MQIKDIPTAHLLQELGTRCRPDTGRMDPVKLVTDHINRHYQLTFAGKVLLKDFACHPELSALGKKEISRLLRRIPDVLVRNGTGNRVTIYGITPR